jgi:polyisoprenyl-teichoic acid--peptidoglycan teichoic acid transferase
VIRRVLAVALVLSAWVAGTAIGSIGVTPHAVGAPLLMIGRAHADYGPTLDGSKPVFILILGSDARPGTPMDHGLSDSIHILGINPAAHRATLYGIPRDSYVPLSTGGTNKINAAMPPGGPEAELQTVENLTGIRFDYYVLTGFQPFTTAVNDLGGLVIDVPYAMQGDAGHYDAGPQRMSGADALAFARTRHFLPLGDFDRSMNQGTVMLSALAQFRAEYTKDPSRLFTWLGTGLRNTQTTLPIDELIKLANLAMSIPAKNVTNLVAHGTTGTVGSQSVVHLTDDNQALWQNLAADGFILQKQIPPAFQPNPT